jgi:hypothetical protein
VHVPSQTFLAYPQGYAYHHLINTALESSHSDQLFFIVENESRKRSCPSHLLLVCGEPSQRSSCGFVVRLSATHLLARFILKLILMCEIDCSSACKIVQSIRHRVGKIQRQYKYFSLSGRVSVFELEINILSAKS